VRVLVANVGSTSFKYQLLDMSTEAVLARGGMERLGAGLSPMKHTVPGVCEVEKEVPLPDHNAAVRAALEELTSTEHPAVGALDEVEAVGFKTVHAGELSGVTLLTGEVLAAMEEYSPVTPGHNPPYLDAIRIFQQVLPGTPLVGVFEPHFHVTMPEKARVYGIPYEWTEQYGLRRYGFHGASHRYISLRAPELLGGVPRERLKIISCHLGGSSSICALDGGKSIDTSMGFSAQSGVQMGTRTGDLDPFIIPFLLHKTNMTLDEITTGLVKRGGLAGISGVGADMRDLEAAADQGNERAQLAIDVYVYGIKKYVGSYITAMNGLDALVFTGGTGEKGARLRAAVCADMDYVGIELDPERNQQCFAQEAVLSPDSARVRVLVVPTNEELIVARETARVVSESVSQA
jgi:acetate kinase